MSVYGYIREIRADHANHIEFGSESVIRIEISGVSMKLTADIKTAAEALVKQMLRDGR